MQAPGLAIEQQRQEQPSASGCVDSAAAEDVEARRGSTLLHRAVAAGGASVVSAVVVNPLDVVKTRLQAQDVVWSMRNLQPQHELLEKWSFAGCGTACLRVDAATGGPAGCGPRCSAAYSGTMDALRKIARTEGPAVLWRGTDASLLMAIPMVGIYLPLYDALLERLQAAGAGLYAPLAAGTLARTAAVCATAPLELARTRVQAAAAGGGLLGLLRQAPAGGGPPRLAGLWTGLGATLARDVPFSALYWGLVEPTRGALLPADRPASEAEVLAANIAAGGLSGAAAGAVTTPMDVVKTRVQLAAGPSAVAAHPLLRTLHRIAAEEGLAALFKGYGARAAKAAPACAIVLSAYEGLKHLYE